jgi:hypothetical protein
VALFDSELILRLVAVFVWFILKDHIQSMTNLMNDLDVNVADSEPEA